MAAVGNAIHDALDVRMTGITNVAADQSSRSVERKRRLTPVMAQVHFSAGLR